MTAAVAPALARKAQHVTLAPHASVREVAHAAIAEGRAHLAVNAAQLRPAFAPDVVHQTRVALRRLRVFLRVFRAELGRERAEQLAGELRWLFRLLGVLRDLEVFAHSYLAQARTPAARALRPRLQRRSRSAQRALTAALDGARFRRLCAALAELEADLAEPPPERARRARRWLAKRLRKQLKRALSQFEAVLRRDPKDLHRLRKQLKKLRYTAELGRDLYPSHARRARKFAKRLGALQDLLGALIDGRNARALLEQLRAPEPLRGRLAGRLAQAQAEPLAELERSFQRFADANPFWS